MVGPSDEPTGSLQRRRAAGGSDRRSDSGLAQGRQRTDGRDDECGGDAGRGLGGLAGGGGDLPRHNIRGDPHLKQHARRGRPVVLQADGTAAFGEVVHAVDVCRAEGAKVFLATPAK